MKNIYLIVFLGIVVLNGCSFYDGPYYRLIVFVTFILKLNDTQTDGRKKKKAIIIYIYIRVRVSCSRRRRVHTVFIRHNVIIISYGNAWRRMKFYERSRFCFQRSTRMYVYTYIISYVIRVYIIYVPTCVYNACIIFSSGARER